MSASDFLGHGWPFPPTVPEGGGPIEPLADQDEAVRQSIWMILNTAPGERVMRPDFGCGIHDLVFQPNDVTTATAVVNAVRTAVSLWEPRVDVLDVVAVPDAAEPSLLGIELDVRVRATNSRFNLVYPFYLE